jgi:hypothetical protein
VPIYLRLARRAALATGISLLLGLGFSAAAQAYIYWSTAHTIGRSNLDGSGVNKSFIPSGDSWGVAVDAAHIYWSASNTVGRANLDGSSPNPQFISTGQGLLQGVAVDAAHVYWADLLSNRIGRANLDGSGVNPDFITAPSAPLQPGEGLSGPHAVAVDAAHIYWGALRNSAEGNTIGRANLDGSGVNRSFITAAAPTGVAVDSAHLYWTNYAEGRPSTIGRANLDGSGVNQGFITGVQPFGGVAVDAGHVYWSNHAPRRHPAIGRTRLDGTGANPSFIPLPTAVPHAVAVDALGHGNNKARCTRAYKRWKKRHRHATARQRRSELRKLHRRHGCSTHLR